MNQVIEGASPLGKNFGQKLDATDTPDYQAIKPEEREYPEIPTPEAMVHAQAQPLDPSARPDFSAMKPERAE